MPVSSVCRVLNQVTVATHPAWKNAARNLAQPSLDIVFNLRNLR
jgi:hypothetical protein